MAELKTQPTKASVAAFLDTIADPQRRAEAQALAQLIRKTTGRVPALWGSSIVGYGQMTYEGANGRVGDWFPVGFSPRKAALTVYLAGGLSQRGELLQRLGPHRVGGGCLYLPKFAEVDLQVLSQLIRKAFRIQRIASTRARPAKQRTRTRAV
jgi:hypothetical protein